MKIILDMDTINKENLINKILDVDTILVTGKGIDEYIENLVDAFDNVSLERFDSRFAVETYIRLQLIQDDNYLYTHDKDFARELNSQNIAYNMDILNAYFKLKHLRVNNSIQDNIHPHPRWGNTVVESSPRFKVLMRG